VGEGRVFDVAFSLDGKTVAAGFGGGNYRRETGGVTLWDPDRRPWTQGAVLAEGQGADYSVAFHPDGKILAVRSRRTLTLWDVAESKQLEVHDLAGGSALAFSPEGKVLAAGTVLWDVAGRRRLEDLPPGKMPGAVHSVAFSPDGKLFAAGKGVWRRGGSVSLWDLEGRKRLTAPELTFDAEVYGVAFSPDSRTLAIGCGDRVVLWDVAEGKQARGSPLAVDEGFVQGVAFSPDGKLLAAGFNNNAYRGGVVLWSVADRRRLVPPLAVNEGEIRRVAFDGDGKTLATAFSRNRLSHYDGGVVLWDVASCQRLGLAPLVVREGGGYDIAFDNSGRNMAVKFYAANTNREGVLLFSLSPERWVSLAKKVANRNLTLAEWKQYLPDEGEYRRTFPDLPDPDDVPRTDAKR
jgi:WD40 repeat protein